MGVVSRGFRSALLVVGGLTVFWNVFLNERAKKSVKEAHHHNISVTLLCGFIS